jgi:hypothetical protein
LNNDKYDPQAVQLLRKTYAILVHHAEKQLDKRSCLKRREGVPQGFIVFLLNLNLFTLLIIIFNVQ